MSHHHQRPRGGDDDDDDKDGRTYLPRYSDYHSYYDTFPAPSSAHQEPLPSQSNPNYPFLSTRQGQQQQRRQLTGAVPDYDPSSSSSYYHHHHHGSSYEEEQQEQGDYFPITHWSTSEERELASKTLQIQSKRFYIDVKENPRGRFIKIAEVGADGRRSQIYLALSTAGEFRDHLGNLSDYYSSLGPPNPENVPEDGKLRSEVMVKANRRYYLDLKENPRGRFLRVSQTVSRGGPRSQIAIPAQGMIEFRDALTDLIDEFGLEDRGFTGELPEGKHLRVDNKIFYFDVGQNSRGVFMRVSEVKTNFRNAITIPEKSWSRFRDIFSEYVEKVCAQRGQGQSQPGASASVVSGETSAQLDPTAAATTPVDIPVVAAAAAAASAQQQQPPTSVQKETPGPPVPQ